MKASFVRYVTAFVLTLALCGQPWFGRVVGQSQNSDSHTAYRIRVGLTKPATCNPGDVFFVPGTGTYVCQTTNTWQPIPFVPVCGTDQLVYAPLGTGFQCVTVGAGLVLAGGTLSASGIATNLPFYVVTNYASFAAAVAAIGSTPATLVIQQDSAVAASITVPSTLTLWFTNSGRLTVAGGQTVTINGSVEAPDVTIFAGSGSVVFGANVGKKPTAKVQWFGAACDNVTNDTTAINNAFAAITSGASGGEVKFPGGATCRANVTLPPNLKGIRVTGDSRFSTTIKGVAGVALPTVQTNGLWYSQFEGITFSAATALTSAGVFELDGNYDGTNTQGVQGNTFKDCFFDSAGIADYAFAIVRRGQGAAQGSENLFLNCHFQQPSRSGVLINGANALQNTFIGGNFQQYTLYGIEVQRGSALCYSVGFQYAGGSTGARNMVDRVGWDFIIFNSVDDHIILDGCRTESPKFFASGNFAAVSMRDNTVIPPISSWAPNATYAQGAIVKGITGGNGDGKIYIALVGGTSAGTEPTWPTTNAIFNDTGASITSGSDQPTLVSGLNGAGIGSGIIIVGAGVAGANLYTTVTATSPITLATTASTTVTGKRYNVGATVVDNGVTWLQYDYDVVSLGGPSSVSSNNLVYGRVNAGSSSSSNAQKSPITLFNNNFSRADWLRGSGPNGLLGKFTFMGNTCLLNGGPNSATTVCNYGLNVLNGGPAVSTYQSPFGLGGQTLVWTGGTGSVNQAAISLAPDFANNILILTGLFQHTPKTLAAMGTPADGTEGFCSNCNVNTDPCTTGGTGAKAIRANGRWYCP